MISIAIIISGVIAGLWLSFSPGTLCISSLGFGLIYLFSLRLKEAGQRKFFITVCLAALLARFGLSFFNYYFSYIKGIGVDFIPDARAYSTSGQYIVEAITGKKFGIENNEVAWLYYLRDIYSGLLPDSGYRVDSFARYIGFLYSLFGYDPLTIKFINSILSVFTGVLVFMLANKMFPVKIANITLVLVVFWPSLFLWSITGLKDPLLFFLIILVIYIYLEYIRKKFRLFEYTLLLLSLLTSNYLIFFILLLVQVFCLGTPGSSQGGSRQKYKIRRFFTKDTFSLVASVVIIKLSCDFIHLVRPFVFAVLICAFMVSAITFFKKRHVIIFIILACVALLFGVKIFHNFDFNKFYGFYIRQTVDHQYCQVVAADSGYCVFPQEYYNSTLTIPFVTLIFSYFNGLAYALFSPFLFFGAHNAFGLFASLLNLLFYALFPFILLGMGVMLRYKWKDALFILMFIFFTISAYALLEGNIGTMFRHRDLLMALFLFFAAVGIGKWLGYVDNLVDK